MQFYAYAEVLPWRCNSTKWIERRYISCLLCVGSWLCAFEWGYPKIHTNMCVWGGRMWEHVLERVCVCIIHALVQEATANISRIEHNYRKWVEIQTQSEVQPTCAYSWQLSIWSNRGKRPPLSSPSDAWTKSIYSTKITFTAVSQEPFKHLNVQPDCCHGLCEKTCFQVYLYDELGKL